MNQFLFCLWAGPVALPSPYSRTVGPKFDKSSKKLFFRALTIVGRRLRDQCAAFKSTTNRSRTAGQFSRRSDCRQSSVPERDGGTAEFSRRSHRCALGTRRCARARSRNRAQADQLDESEIRQQPRPARRKGRGNSHRTRTQTIQTKAAGFCGDPTPPPPPSS